MHTSTGVADGCTMRFQGLREVQVIRIQTGGAQSKQRLVKDEDHLGGSRVGSSKQIRMVLECGLNQGQGFSVQQLNDDLFVG